MKTGYHWLQELSDNIRKIWQCYGNDATSIFTSTIDLRALARR